MCFVGAVSGSRNGEEDEMGKSCSPKDVSLRAQNWDLSTKETSFHDIDGKFPLTCAVSWEDYEMKMNEDEMGDFADLESKKIKKLRYTVQ